ncbi:HEAT repeat domain-containing protein [Actinacidiphila sp. DG2A-62]|uniref:HEAT repeat domain-containing protein n=1 Tax=Actinacidiphila sp. DG2A-62 TaxID=3108821 RepID=UPI002DBC1799|nr:HEAT repeat domain-containing protein [Actinacidiphila sp. DG2A-62]MEC3998521.1 HEAT repeat domain-containing protein [Actinacidiphila sp. DG2A-62]
MFDPDIAPSGTLLGLLQRGRGDGPLHALAAPRAEALAALEQCVLRDPRLDWRVESRSLYYARLYSDLEGPLDGIEQHLFHPDDLVSPDEHRCGLALSVLGHLAGYGRRDALRLLRRYAAAGGCWEWALDELAVRDDEAGLRALGPAVVARFPATEEGEADLARAVREAYEPRPWQLWAEDGAHPATAERVRRAAERVSFDRWQRQLRSGGPTPGWSVAAVLEWAQDGLAAHPGVERDQPAARCLGAVAGPEDRPALLRAALHGPSAARAAALRHLTDRRDPARFDLIEAAAGDGDERVLRAAVESFERLRDAEALERARIWADRADARSVAADRTPPSADPLGPVDAPGGLDPLGSAAARVLARHGGPEDAGRVLSALRRTVRIGGADADGLDALIEGVGRLASGAGGFGEPCEGPSGADPREEASRADAGDRAPGADARAGRPGRGDHDGRATACRAAPVLRHVYRETSSSHLRGTAAHALAEADPGFAAGFAVECLWDCEESTRELAARRAASGDVRVLAQLRRLAADPAEEAEVQTAVRGRLSAGGAAR